LGTGISTFSGNTSINLSGGTVSSTLITSIDENVSVPTVTGLTQAAAQTAITAAGLVVGTVTQASSATVAAGDVISQSPTAGTAVAQGSAVNLVISSTFTALTATLTTARGAQTATLLPSGLILITGGTMSSGHAVTVLNTAEVYNPVANTFTALTATMTAARAGHTATLLPNGRVLITGGYNNLPGPADLNTAELYDPVANAFTALTATMTTARADHTATLLPNGQVLLTGGENASNTIINTAELYDPVANTFTALTATMTTARGAHTATLLPNGQVLLTGGLGNTSFTPVSTAEVYDPVANTFTALTATMTTARGAHTATLLPNGQVLITGGYTGQTQPALNTAEVYEALPPSVNAFTALTATLTTARAFPTSTLLPDGQVLLTGGVTSGGSPPLNTAELYDPVASTFTALTATMTSVRDQHTATLLPNGKVLIAGGQNNANGNGLNTAEVYDPVAQTFTALTATMTTGRENHTATLLPNGQVLLTGGLNGSGPTPLNTAEVYDPVANTFTAINASMTTGREGHVATLLPNGQVLLAGGVIGTSPSSFTALNSAELYAP